MPCTMLWALSSRSALGLQKQGRPQLRAAAKTSPQFGQAYDGNLSGCGHWETPLDPENPYLSFSGMQSEDCALTGGARNYEAIGSDLRALELDLMWRRCKQLHSWFYVQPSTRIGTEARVVPGSVCCFGRSFPCEQAAHLVSAGRGPTPNIFSCLDAVTLGPTSRPCKGLFSRDCNCKRE